ncbi:MAG: LysM peptidoglycan-binding domain-containing protein [Anaerolineales bacterium]|nr:LysM peptidoglycan-binding domain-containing protein [Anaerolineales bacterium]
MSLCLAACISAPAAPSPTPTLRPMPIFSPSPALRTPPVTPVIIASPTPSPTPVTHVVRRGETLIGIAVRYGVSLEALQQANPTVSAQFLSIGTTLIIPSSEDSAVIRAAGAPTPIPVIFNEPACYPQATGALICFVAARNPGELALEVVTARVTLAGADGLPLAEAVAGPALEVLLPGGVTPLIARFAPPLIRYAAIGVTPLSAYPLADVASRLVPLIVRTDSISSGALSWTAQGQVLNESGAVAGRVRLALVLWAEDGTIAGLRQLDWAEPLAPGEVRAFTLTASSAGARVVRAEVLAEGQP